MKIRWNEEKIEEILSAIEKITGSREEIEIYPCANGIAHIEFKVENCYNVL